MGQGCTISLTAKKRYPKKLSDLILRNHISVSISHQSLKLTILRMFFNVSKIVQTVSSLSEIQHQWIAPKRSDKSDVRSIIAECV